MRADYWMVTNDEVVEKTGKKLGHWTNILEEFGAEDKKPAECVTQLQEAHGIPRYWARTLVTRYQKGIRD